MSPSTPPNATESRTTSATSWGGPAASLGPWVASKFSSRLTQPVMGSEPVVVRVAPLLRTSARAIGGDGLLQWEHTQDGATTQVRGPRVGLARSDPEWLLRSPRGLSISSRIQWHAASTIRCRPSCPIRRNGRRAAPITSPAEPTVGDRLAMLAAPRGVRGTCNDPQLVDSPRGAKPGRRCGGRC